MIRSMLNRTLGKCAAVLASAALVLAAAAPAQGASVTLPVATVPVQIIGADSFCTGGFVVGGTASAPTLTCITGGGAGLPSGCTLTPASTTLGVGGGSVALTAFCSSGTLPISFALTGGAFQGLTGTQTSAANGATIAATVTASATVGGTATNAAGPANLSNASITVQTGGGGGGGTGLCAQYANVLPTVNATWGQPGSWHSVDSGSFGDNAVWVFKLTVPAGTPASITAGSFTTAEYGGPNTPRQLTISTQACDFRPRDYQGVNGPLSLCSDGTTCQLSYAVQAPQLFGGVAGLTAGQTYYINVRNFSNYPTPGYDCGQTSCGAIMNHAPAWP